MGLSRLKFLYILCFGFFFTNMTCSACEGWVYDTGRKHIFADIVASTSGALCCCSTKRVPLLVCGAVFLFTLIVQKQTLFGESL